MPALGGMVHEAAVRLRAGPHPECARRDSETLLLHVLDKSRAWLMAHGDSAPNEDQARQYADFVERRFTGEPIQYITGEQEFFGLPFHVSKDVLIPRPETEHLVEKAVELAHSFSTPHIVDVGTGSGAIAIAMAHSLPEARVTAVDVSAAALEVAGANALRNGVGDRIRLVESDLLAALKLEKFKVLVSNSPYVATADRESLSVEVRDHEPGLALFAGHDGLDVYRRLIPQAYAVLDAGGFAVLEIGYGQSEAIAALLRQAGFEKIEFVADLQGIPRVVCAQRPSSSQSARPVLFSSR
jgi:release factor glutamine methyltransferase